MSLVFVRCVYLMESLRIMSRVFYAFMKEMYDQCTSFSLFRFIYFLWLVEARTKAKCPLGPTVPIRETLGPMSRRFSPLSHSDSMTVTESPNLILQ